MANLPENWYEDWAVVEAALPKVKAHLKKCYRKGAVSLPKETDEDEEIQKHVFDKPHEVYKIVYDKYLEIFEEYIDEKVLRDLRVQHLILGPHSMLNEICATWSRHRIMVAWVYSEFRNEVKSLLIDQECEWKLDNFELFKYYLDCFIELEMGYLYAPRDLDKLDRILTDRINKVISSIEGKQDSTHDSMMLYLTIFKVCQNDWRDHEIDLRMVTLTTYKEVFKGYISTKQKSELREQLQTWLNHVNMNNLLSRCFTFLVRVKCGTPKMDGIQCIQNLVHPSRGLILRTLREAIDQEHKSERIDRDLLMGITKLYEATGHSLIKTIIDDTIEYYSQKASEWITKYPGAKIVPLIGESLRLENDWATQCLDPHISLKLLEALRSQLTSSVSKLFEKEYYGFHKLLGDDSKVDDLSTMFTVLSEIPESSHQVAGVFKQHITTNCAALVKQGELAASHEKIIVRKNFELYDMYLACVNKGFNKHPLFVEALEEAFGDYLFEQVDGYSSAEYHSTVCDDTIKEQNSGCAKTLGENSLDLVTKLLGYISDRNIFAELCRENLAHRLLFCRSEGDQHERSFLKKIETEAW